MNEMTYQNYSAKVEYDPIDKIFVGHIIGIRDIVGFHGSTVEELESAFHDAVDHYLEVCEKIGQPPQRSYSGKLTLRIPPEIHMAVATAAEINSKSINQWATDVLKQAAMPDVVS
ncbi:MAG: type II toxin-antitoxin system HicB family antitoxin [Chloroflexi bacterium]|nr:type II toxin-antitoxin system HicB family antitoxin [Chloroflexota bacterium]MBK7915421.1 type II toxin-antitoxin system HicB family antitoxin [Chloroflexota bacterium]